MKKFSNITWLSLCSVLACNIVHAKEIVSEQQVTPQRNYVTFGDLQSTQDRDFVRSPLDSSMYNQANNPNTASFIEANRLLLDRESALSAGKHGQGKDNHNDNGKSGGRPDRYIRIFDRINDAYDVIQTTKDIIRDYQERREWEKKVQESEREYREWKKQCRKNCNIPPEKNDE